ncbi:Mitochondrial matrix cochaperone [Coelomomyces lativittatus]|nr:Mitochondrial matrix cochaperone [Coelomomyces lativittatus]
MMKDLLTTLDTLGLAIASVANEKETLLKNPALKNVYDGLVMTQEAFLSTLHHYGVRRMDVVEGDVFQPHQHHALFEVPKLDAVPGTVVQSAW